MATGQDALQRMISALQAAQALVGSMASAGNEQLQSGQELEALNSKTQELEQTLSALSFISIESYRQSYRQSYRNSYMIYESLISFFFISFEVKVTLRSLQRVAGASECMAAPARGRWLGPSQWLGRCQSRPESFGEPKHLGGHEKFSLNRFKTEI